MAAETAPETLSFSQNPLRDYWDIAIRRRAIIFTFCFICGVTTLIANYLMTPLYRATATIAVEGEDIGVTNAYQSASTQNTSFDIYENYLQTQMEVIRSRTVAGKVFDEMKLKDTLQYAKRKDPLKVFIKQDIELERLKGARVIKLSVYNPNAELAAEIANRLAESYAETNLNRRAVSFIRAQRMAGLNAEYQSLQSKLTDLSNLYGPKHPEMIRIRQEIKHLSSRIENEGKVVSESPDADTAKENDQLMEEALSKIQESSVFSSSRMNNILIMDRATVPTEKASPKRILNTLIGFVAGLIAGCMLAFFVDYCDDTVKKEDDLRKIVKDHSFLGTLFVERNGGTQPGQKEANDHLMDKRPDTPSAEAYRMVRTAIEWSTEGGKGLPDLAVTSSIPGEGKTTVSSNLAIAMTQIGKKVLLVDTDFRKGRIHHSYKLKNDKGLSDYLTGTVPMESVIQATNVPNLWVVTTGKSGVDLSHLLKSKKMTQFIEDARKKYDMTVYDTPPVSIISDAAILMRQLSGVLLAVRSGHTRSRILMRAAAIIKNSGANVIGMVLNGSESREDLSYYRKYYHQK